jgi:general L-amino acid transport system permease protein
MKRWLAVCAGVVLVVWCVHNAAANLAARGLTLGFGFLGQPANFAIGDTAWLRFGADDTVGRAILVGLINTARVSLLGCVLALVLGFALGLSRLSGNPGLTGLTRAYVETIRSTPLLLLLLFLAALLHGLPPAARALSPFHGVFLSDRGLYLPGVRLWPLGLDIPRHTRFDFVGGIALSPELAALLAALVLHQSAHISEVVRGAMLAVPKGQIEAAHALGLSHWQTLRLVTVPQALKAMVPLLAGNCVSLIKNSSLAVAIGFPDVVSVLNTVGNQTGHNVETMVIMVGVYLFLSLAVASLLNRFNARLTA